MEDFVNGGDEKIVEGAAVVALSVDELTRLKAVKKHFELLKSTIQVAATSDFVNESFTIKITMADPKAYKSWRELLEYLEKEEQVASKRGGFREERIR